MNTMTNFPTDRLKVIREAAQAYYPPGTLYEEKAVSAFIRGAKWKQCIPYKGNEHLSGTTNDCDDFYKTW